MKGMVAMKKINQMVRTGLICFLLIIISTASVFGAGSKTSWLMEKPLDEWGLAALNNMGEDIRDISYGVERNTQTVTTTDYARFIIGDRSRGDSVAEYAQALIEAQMASGKFADEINGQGESLINAHIWSILGLYMAYEDEYDKEAALSWLKAHQNLDGSFPIFVQEDPQSGSPDLTAMGVCAYAALGLDQDAEEIEKAMAYLEAHIDEMEKTRTGASAETISWWLMAKAFLREEIAQEDTEKLLPYELEGGGFMHFKGGRRANYMATYHALLALGDVQNGKSWMHVLRYRNGFKTREGVYYTMPNIMAYIYSGQMRPDSEGLFSWEVIRQALKEK